MLCEMASRYKNTKTNFFVNVFLWETSARGEAGLDKFNFVVQILLKAADRGIGFSPTHHLVCSDHNFWYDSDELFELTA